ncbi:MFS transporter [Mollicutes bacterium LVI A0039]|nr:MFS transporter [Mollicutes bacterium LVI A0039]
MKNNYKWIILIIGVLAQITFSIGFSGIAVSSVIMQEVYKFEVNQLGFVLGCMGLGVALSEMIWGVVTDKIGDKAVLLIGLFLMAISYAYIAYMCVPVAGYYPDYRYLGGMLIITGMVGGSINSSSGHAVMSWFDDNTRGFAMSVRQTAVPIGAAIGSMVFPYIADQTGFKSAFLFMAILCLITFCIVTFGLKIKLNNNLVTQQEITELKSPYKRLSIWKIALAGGALTIPQMAIMSFGAVYLMDVFQIKMLTISAIIAFIQLGGGIFRIVTGLISDKFKNRIQVICIISIICSFSGILLAIISESNLYIIVCLFITLGIASNSWHGVGYTEIAVKSGIKYSGRALGMMGMLVFTISFLTPYFIPYILITYSWPAVWLFVGIMSITALPLIKNC